ncbi:MAG: LysM peptidoglycan-binding domain-containing protein, partial [Rhodocyclales bacterium]|nr:LysM peptidoglycan-binding domain-containing protein [Rhodocyclales bacterium]
TVRYLKNGQVLRTVSTTAGRTFYFDSSFSDTGYTLNAIQFAAPFLTAGGSAAIDRYAYDAAGNRIAHTNALGDVEKTYYDSLSRVTGSRDYLGFATTYTYAYSNAILGLDGVQVGGWRKTTTNAVGRTLVDDQDAFGRTTWHRDLGGRQFTYRYNAAGWLTSQTGSNGQNIATDHYANGYVKSIWDKTTGAYTRYEYDAEGNRIFEGYIYLKNPADLNGGVRDYHQYANIEYDEHNRIKRILDPKAEIRYEFDANGNRRRVLSTYHDGINGAMRTQDYWYQYDAMNRFTVTMGQLSTGTRATSAGDTAVSIVKGSTGSAIAYDLGGQRRQAANGSDGTVEDYSYSADGYLEDVRIGGVLRSRRNEDLLGRVTSYTEWNSAGAQTYSRVSVYDKNSRVVSQSGSDGSTSNTYYTDATDNAGTASQSGAGELAKSVSTNGGTTVTSYFAYDYWDEAKEKAVTAQAWNPLLKGNNAYWRPGYAYHAYDVNGHLQEAADAGADGALGTADDRSFRYVSDAQGLILLRDEIAAGRVNRVQRYYYANGVRIGDVGNDGPSRTDYTQAIARRGMDRKNYKNWRPVASADFDQNYEPVSPAYPGMTPGAYTVRSGDTLQGIARSVWGDASLWYLIADANGLSGTETLTAGQVLSLPNKLTNVHNNAGTFRPYNPGEAIGDTSPTIPDAPPPPKPKGKKGKCGGIGSIIVAIVVVVATIYTAGAAGVAMGSSAATGAATAATAAGAGTFGATMAAGVAAMGSMTAVGFAAAAIGGAIGSVVGQGLSMAMGLQDKFSWGGVAAGALGAMAGAAVGGLAGGNVLVSAAASNVASQGVNLLTGQQREFSWASLAASVISAPIASSISGSLLGQGGAFAGASSVQAALVSSTTRPMR